MKTITLNVEDDFLLEFLDELDNFIQENDIKENELTIFGLTLEKYRETVTEKIKK